MDEYLLPLKSREEIAQSTMKFVFDTSGTDFSFQAGQYCDFELIEAPTEEGRGARRTFSIASSPNRKDELMIAVRMREGSNFKQALKKVDLGTEVKMKGPWGDFAFPDESKEVVYIAGGIGITPFHSMINYWVEEDLEHELKLIYSNRTLDLAAFHEELEEIDQKKDKFELISTLTQEIPKDWKYEAGRIDELMIEEYVDDIDEVNFFITGTPGMVSAMFRMLVEIEIDEDRINREMFSGY